MNKFISFSLSLVLGLSIAFAPTNAYAENISKFVESVSNNKEIDDKEEQKEIEITNEITKKKASASGHCGDWYENEGENVKWFYKNGVLTISGKGKICGYESDCERDSNDVSYHYDQYFNYRDKIKSIEIQNGITAIGDGAFYDFYNVKNVKIADSVKVIGKMAFAVSGIETISMPGGLEKIEKGAFKGCNSLKKIHIPKNVNSIGKWAFLGCSSLSSITVNAANKYYCVEKGVLYDAKKTKLVYYMSSNQAESFTIPKTVTTICDAAFRYNRHIQSVKLPDDLKTIEGGAFEHCSNLKEINIPKSVTQIGDRALYDTEWIYNQKDSFVIMNGFLLKYQGDEKTVKIPDSATVICKEAFNYYSPITSITIPHSVIKIEKGSLGDSDSLQKIIVDKNNKKYASDSGILYDKKKKRIIVCPRAITGTVTIPETVTKLDAYVFSELNNKPTLIFKGKAPALEEGCFSHSKMTVQYHGNKEGWSTGTIKNYDGTITCKNAVAEQHYGGSVNWKNLDNRISAYDYILTASSKNQICRLEAYANNKTKLTYKPNNSNIKVDTSGKVTVNRGFVGEAKITITAAATKKYGKTSKIVMITVLPPEVSFSTISSTKGKISVKWSKQAYITGYQIYWSPDSSFTEGKTKSYNAKASSGSLAVSGLKSGKYYYFQIRTYKKIGDKTYYGPWSWSMGELCK